jgi:hypothetical protein
MQSADRSPSSRSSRRLVVTVAAAGLLAGGVGAGVVASQRTNAPSSSEAVLVDADQTEHTRRVLADGVVTPAEHRETVEVVVNCATDEGVDIDPTTFVLYDGSDPSYQLPVSDADRETLQACYLAHGRDIDVAFQTQPSTTRQRAEHFAEVAACLEAHDIDVAARAAEVLSSRPTPVGNEPLGLDDLSLEDQIGFAAMTVDAADPVERDAFDGCSERPHHHDEP